MTKEQIAKRNGVLKGAEEDLRDQVSKIMGSLDLYQDIGLTKAQMLQLLQDRIMELVTASGVYRY